jgi:peptidoglycan hydrolase-like protein with peptidoglycan-binding domain
MVRPGPTTDANAYPEPSMALIGGGDGQADASQKAQIAEGEMFKNTVSMGSTGEDVKRVQRALSRLSKGQDLAATADGFGTFGPNLDQAVRAFQQSAAIAVDGIVGPITWGVLPPYCEGIGHLGLGSLGPAVAGLQQWLTTFSDAGINQSPGPIDGYFGPMTQAALQVRQAVGEVTDEMWLEPVQDAHAVVDSLERHCNLLFMM